MAQRWFFPDEKNHRCAIEARLTILSPKKTLESFFDQERAGTARHRKQSGRVQQSRYPLLSLLFLYNLVTFPDWLYLELARKNGVSKVGDSFMCNGVACSKATGLTYCNVEWVNA
jgi:hypothetical protein